MNDTHRVSPEVVVLRNFIRRLVLPGAGVRHRRLVALPDRVPGAVKLFIPPGAAEADLRAFQMPDLFVAAPVSLAAAVSIFLSLRWAVPLAWFAAGAMVYAFVYCVAWSIARDGAWLNVALMAPAALFSNQRHRHQRQHHLDFQAGGAWGRTPRRRDHWPDRGVLVVLPVCRSGRDRVRRAATGVAVFRIPAQRVVGGLLFVAFSSLGLASGLTMASRGPVRRCRLTRPIASSRRVRMVTCGIPWSLPVSDRALPSLCGLDRWQFLPTSSLAG